MDEVAGYLPPTADAADEEADHAADEAGPAFGVGVVLSTQNPVDVDYKALSNAGTWMIGRLQTERDKRPPARRHARRRRRGRRRRDRRPRSAGWPSASSCCRRAGKDQPEVFTTRWAMSYLRDPMTRADQALMVRWLDRHSRGSARTLAPLTGAPLPAPVTARQPRRRPHLRWRRARPARRP